MEEEQEEEEKEGEKRKHLRPGRTLTREANRVGTGKETTWQLRAEERRVPPLERGPRLTTGRRRLC